MTDLDLRGNPSGAVQLTDLLTNRSTRQPVKDVPGITSVLADALRAAAPDVTYLSEMMIELIRVIKVDPDSVDLSPEAKAVIAKNPRFFEAVEAIRRETQSDPKSDAAINDLYVQCLICVATLPPPKQKKASIKAARELCGVAASYIEAGQPVPGPLRPYVAAALKAISQGKDAGEAFRTNRGSGNQNDPLDAMKRDRIVAKRVRQVIAQHGWEDDPEKAYIQVADEITRGRGEFASPLFASVAAWTTSYVGKMYRRLIKP